MEHSLLVEFLDGKISPEDFCRDISKDVDAFKKAFRSPANLGYIVITDGPQTTVKRKHMRRLLQCLVDESVSWRTANYVGECLVISENFRPLDEVVAGSIAFIADKIRPPTAGEVGEAIVALNQVCYPSNR